MKQFLAEKRKERATRMGSVENVKTKVYSAERHNQPNMKFWSSAHKDRPVGISGQNEPNGSKSSAANGISCHNPNDNATQPQPQHYGWVGHENFSATSRPARELKFGTDTH